MLRRTIQFLTQPSRALLLAGVLLYLTSHAAAATYDFDGSTNNDWNTPDNWTVTGSALTWPNQEFGNEYINQDATNINIGAAFNVNRPGGLSIDGPRGSAGTNTLTIDGSLTVGTTLWIADDLTSDIGRVVVNGTLNASTVDAGNDTNGIFDVNSSGVVNAAEIRVLRGNTTGTWNGDVNTTGSIRLGLGTGSSSEITIDPNADVDVGGTFYIADESGTGSHLVTMNGGTVDASRMIIGDDGGSGTFTMNDGVTNITGGAGLYVAWVGGVDGNLNVNGGLLDIDANLFVGNNAGADGDVVIDGGIIEAGSISFNDLGLLTLLDGMLRIDNTTLTEEDMQSLIDNGNIVVPSGYYGISTDGNFTTLATPEPETIAIWSILGVMAAMFAYRRRRRVANGLSDK